MKYLFNGQVFDTKEQADAAAEVFIGEFMQRESYRFSIAKETISGNNTTWSAADLENDPEDSIYFVFNTLNGLHEKVSSKTQAVAKLEEIKQEFIIFSGLTIQEISDLDAISYMENLLENTNGPVLQ